MIPYRQQHHRELRSKAAYPAEVLYHSYRVGRVRQVSGGDRLALMVCFLAMLGLVVAMLLPVDLHANHDRLPDRPQDLEHAVGMNDGQPERVA
jgi:hypothetical protein